MAGLQNTAKYAAMGSVVPGIGTAIGGAVGFAQDAFGKGGFLAGDDGPDYSKVTDLYNQRNAQIGQFAASLASARAKYLTSLNNMYNSAFARFSGNAEAGFANRGLAVNGGAFASALAKKTAEYQSQLEPSVFEAEGKDLRSVDAAYGANNGNYMQSIAPGAGMAYKQENDNMTNIGGFVGKLGLMYAGSRMGVGGTAGPVDPNMPKNFPGGSASWNAQGE